MAGRFFGRGGEKLQAALDHFGLAKILEGASAIDVGASTGGFTHCMLLAGARAVCAVDVGTGQLHTELAKDPRVESHERTDFKTLTLKKLPGPFDFFSVDVSFVAARSMLRGLAFRLRAGAQGIVLVKPQFELPERFVKRGGFVDAAYHEAAVEQLRQKGAKLGFTLLGYLPCPVEIASGTVELLVHLRFAGRTAHLPAAPESAQAGAASTRTHGSRAAAKSAQRIYELFAVASPGFEEIVEREVSALPGVTRVSVVPGGVEFVGNDEVLYRANLWLRVATRVLVRLGNVTSGHFASFRRRAAKLPWSEFIAPGKKRSFRVESSVTHCRLYHTGALAENIALAAGGQVHVRPTKDPAAERDSDDDSVQRILLRGHDDHFQISIDTSGSLLHKRGWRLEAGVAPLRETHAAALLALCNWQSGETLLDPMCGAGTIAIEAASIACGQAPGIERKFAFFSWPSFDEPLWQKLCQEARNAVRQQVAVSLVGWDTDAVAVERAQRNAERAGVGDLIKFEVRDLLQTGDFHKDGGGLLLCNPPYGKRMGSRSSSRSLLDDLVTRLKASFASWRVGLLLPEAMVRSGLPFVCTSVHPVSSGGLRLALVQVAAGGMAKDPVPKRRGHRRRSKPRTRSRRDPRPGQIDT